MNRLVLIPIPIMNKILIGLFCALFILLCVDAGYIKCDGTDHIISDDEFRVLANSCDELIDSGLYWEFGYSSSMGARIVLDIPDAVESDPICAQVQVIINVYDSPQRDDRSIVRNTNLSKRHFLCSDDNKSEKWFVISDGHFSVRLVTTSEDAITLFEYEIDRMLNCVNNCLFRSIGKELSTCFLGC